MQNWNSSVTVFSKNALLDTIRTPADLPAAQVKQIREVADELRQENH